MEMGRLEFVTLTALWSFVFYSIEAQGQPPYPCCSQNSTTSCCQHPLCDSYNQSVSCTDLNSNFFTMEGLGTDDSRCNVSLTTTAKPDTNITTSPPLRPFICVENCPDGYYSDSNRVCQKCDESCRNCNASGSELSNCACASGHDNGTHCCPPDTRAEKRRNSTICSPVMPQRPSEFPVIPVAAGAGGGVLLVVICIVVFCCCCRRRNGRNTTDADDGSRRTKRRPISQMIQDKLGISSRKSQARSSLLNPNNSQSLQPVYANVESGDHGTIATHAQRKQEQKTRYTKDPTMPSEAKSSKKFMDRPVTGMYQNDSAIRLQANTEKDELAKLGVAPAPPGAKTNVKKPPKVTPKPGKAQPNPAPTSDDDSDNKDDYIDMSGKDAVHPPEVQMSSADDGGAVNNAFSGDESPYQNVQYGEEPQEEYENVEFQGKGKGASAKIRAKKKIEQPSVKEVYANV